MRAPELEKAQMELGIYTFGDITRDPHTGRAISVSQRHAEIIAAAKLADEAGLDMCGVGEHHRLDISISSPAAELQRREDHLQSILDTVPDAMVVIDARGLQHAPELKHQVLLPWGQV